MSLGWKKFWPIISWLSTRSWGPTPLSLEDLEITLGPVRGPNPKWSPRSTSSRDKVLEGTNMRHIWQYRNGAMVSGNYLALIKSRITAKYGNSWTLAVWYLRYFSTKPVLAFPTLPFFSDTKAGLLEGLGMSQSNIHMASYSTIDSLLSYHICRLTPRNKGVPRKSDLAIWGHIKHHLRALFIIFCIASLPRRGELVHHVYQIIFPVLAFTRACSRRFSHWILFRAQKGG